MGARGAFRSPGSDRRARRGPGGVLHNPGSRPAWFAVLGLLVALGACSEESGPRSWEVALSRPEGTVASVVLEVTGAGVAQLEATGSTTLYSGLVPGSADRWRVVALVVGEGAPSFRITMSEGASNRPSVTVVEAFDGANVEIEPPSSVEARFQS